jgi:hypothetical protein
VRVLLPALRDSILHIFLTAFLFPRLPGTSLLRLHFIGIFFLLALDVGLSFLSDLFLLSRKARRRICRVFRFCVFQR